MAQGMFDVREPLTWNRSAGDEARLNPPPSASQADRVIAQVAQMDHPQGRS